MVLNRKILFINDWGFNPNPRIFYIADYLCKTLRLESIILGRKYIGIPERNDTTLLKPSYISQKNYTDNTFQANRFRYRLIKEALEIIRKEKPCFIYVRSLYISLVISMFKKKYEFEIIYETHGFAYKEHLYNNKRMKAIFSKLIENSILKMVDYVVTNTQKLSENIIEKFLKLNGKVFVVPNGIDLDEFKNLKDIEKGQSAKWVGFVGNWEYWIEIEDLLKLSDLSESLNVVVVGEGHNYSAMKQKYPKVRFTGKLPKNLALSYLNKMDICVNPWSSNAIFGEKSARKTFEYLILGKPIIVSNVIGKEDFLIEDESCLVYEPGDVKSLLSKVNVLLDDTDKYRLISENSKKLGQNFTWSNILKKSKLETIRAS